MAKRYVCTSCGYVGWPKTVTKGSFLFEVLLWIIAISTFFLLATFLLALLYSHWRSSSRYEVCPKCKHPTMIPTDSPIGRELIWEIGEDSKVG